MNWKGKPLVQYSIEALRPFCDHIIISTNNGEYARFGFPLIKDEYPNIGPMGGLHAGLKASESEHHIVLSCDMPLVDDEIIGLLLNDRALYQVVAPMINEQIFPVCAYYHKSVLEALNKEIGSEMYKMKLFLDKLKVRRIWVDELRLKHKLININTIQELSQLQTNEIQAGDL